MMGPRRPGPEMRDPQACGRPRWPPTRTPPPRSRQDRPDRRWAGLARRSAPVSVPQLPLPPGRRPPLARWCRRGSIARHGSISVRWPGCERESPRRRSGLTGLASCSARGAAGWTGWTCGCSSCSSSRRCVCAPSGSPSRPGCISTRCTTRERPRSSSRIGGTGSSTTSTSGRTRTWPSTGSRPGSCCSRGTTSRRAAISACR